MKYHKNDKMDCLTSKGEKNSTYEKVTLSITDKTLTILTKMKITSTNN